MKLIKKIPQVEKGFFFDGEGLLFQQGETLKLLSLQTLDEKEICAVKHRIVDLHWIDDRIFGITSFGIHIVNSNDFASEFISFDIEGKGIYTSNPNSIGYIVYSKSFHPETFLGKSAVFDLSSLQEVWESPSYGGLTIPLQDQIVYFSWPNLQLFSIKTGDQIWNLSLESILPHFYLISPILSEKEYLILGLDNQLIVSLDCQSGEIIWIMEGDQGGIKFDPENRILHDLYYSRYRTLSIHDGKEIKNFTSIDFFDKNQFISNRKNYVLQGKSIISSDSKTGKIASLNTESMEFDWFFVENDCWFPSTEGFEVKNDILATRDSNGDLRIYKLDAAF